MQPGESTTTAEGATGSNDAPRYVGWKGARIEPTVLKSMSDGAHIGSAAMSPGGEKVWVLVHKPIVDVGRLVNGCAAEIALFGCGTAGVLLIALFWRRAARARTVGVLYCRRCDYDVTTLVGDGGSTRCPECGSLLTRPRAGATFLRRTTLPLAMAAVCAALLTWHLSLGRQSYVSILPQNRWGSSLLQRWSSVPKLTWLAKGTIEGEELREVDARTGEETRTVVSRPRQTPWAAVYNPAARALVLEGHDGGVELVSVDTGAVLAKLRECPPRSSRHNPAIAGQSADGETIWINLLDSDEGVSYLTAWAWRTGVTSRIAKTPSHKSSAGYFYPRHYTLIPGEPVRFFRYPHFMEAFETKTYPVAVVDAEGNEVLTCTLGEEVASQARPSIVPSGEFMYLPHRHGLGIAQYAVSSLTPAEPFSFDSQWPWTALRPDGYLLLLPTNRYGLVAVDLYRGEYAAILTHPVADFAPDSICFSGDGRTVSAVFICHWGANSLGVWRLPPSLAAPEVNDTDPAP